jgi:DNA modification methylase
MQLDKLYNQDCIKGMNLIPEGSVDLAFADPPFNIGYKYDVYEDRRAADDYLDWTRKWGEALVRTLKPTGTFWLAIGDDFAAELKLIFQRELGLCCRSWVVWYYTFGVNCKYKFSRSHTHLFHFVRDPKNFTFNKDAILVPSARQLVYADKRAASKGRLPDDTWILRPQDALDSFTEDEDVWHFPRVCGTFKERAGWHGCQMPEQLLGRIIKACSNPGETVLDPFGGSGTTLVVAKKLARHFVGFELSKNYAQQIQDRLSAAQVRGDLSAPENPATKAPPTAKGKRLKSIPPEPEKTEEPALKVLVPKSLVRGVPSTSDQGIIEAFHATRDGFPVDRVIADPDLNKHFVAKCVRLGLAGTAAAWNHRLMNLRKMGQFKGLPPSKPTTFEYEEREYDRYRFACEIAIQRFEQEEEVSLDSVLCDPDLANAFDRLVLAMLPDEPSSLKIRWFALRLRKAANYISKKSASLAKPVPMPRENNNPFDLDFADVPNQPGLYWLSGNQKHLYVGETENLRERFTVQFGHKKFDFWDIPPEKLKLSFRPVTPRASESLQSHQSCWISTWRPIGNYEKLAARQ